MVSAIIAARNEKYLHQTVTDLLSKAKGQIEVIVVFDGYWPDEFEEDKRVSYVHFSKARGLRNAINCGVSLARGEYILKCDAHVMFADGFDHILLADIKDNWVVVPRRKRLDPEKWELTNGRPPIDYEYLVYPDTDRGLHSTRWDERGKERKDILIDETPSAQGSCWLMKKSYYKELELLDENYGTFFLEFQEIALKAWLSGGRVMVNKKTWYAHWHKTGGRGYSLSANDRAKAVDHMNRWVKGRGWHKQSEPLLWLIDRFDMPGWKKHEK